MRIRVLLAAALAFCTVSPVHSEEVSVLNLPASVVKTTPASGDRAVDAGTTKQITVTFSKEMTDKSWSWSQISDESFPEISGAPRYLEDKMTCVIDVELEPGRTYAVWINSSNFKNFKDAGGKPSVPYLLVFETKRAVTVESAQVYR